MADRTEDTLDARIRQRAYRLWQDDGSPPGRPDEYWHRAAQQIAAEGVDAPPDSTHPGPAFEQSDKQQLEVPVPEESPNDQEAEVSKPRAKRRRI
jgi:hypothetical protein